MSQMSQIRSLYRSLFRRSANIYVSKKRFAVVWLGQIHNLATGHAYLLCLKSGSERLSQSNFIRKTFAVSRSWSQSNFPSRISLTRRWIYASPWNEVGSCLHCSAGIPENPRALWDGILWWTMKIHEMYSLVPRLSPLPLLSESRICLLFLRRMCILSDVLCCGRICLLSDVLCWTRGRQHLPAAAL